MPASASISGILTPHMVPLDARGEINEEELARYVNWLIERGVHGLYPNGSTGEFLRFTAEERRRIVQVVCAAAKGRVPVVAGAAEANLRETIRACEHCLEAGARAVAVVSPFYYKLSPESVYAYFREIGRHSPIDVTLYNIPMLASPIDVPATLGGYLIFKMHAGDTCAAIFLYRPDNINGVSEAGIGIRDDWNRNSGGDTARILRHLRQGHQPSIRQASD
jgi:hypothetical protein